MSYYISFLNDNSFISYQNLGIETNVYHTDMLSKELVAIFNRNNLFVNDYGLNNILLHLIVMIERIRINENISDDAPLDKIRNTKDYAVAVEIKILLEDKFGITISDPELYYLTLLCSSNSNTLDFSFVNSGNINEYIEDKFIALTKKVLKKAEETYYLEAFDEEFIVRFTIHIRNLFFRISNNSYVKNPMTNKIKIAYPLIYDIAVFIANEFKSMEDIYINEDEITFIAFHIGGYFENNNNIKNKVCCVFVYADYYSMHKNEINKITKIFGDSIEIINTASIKDIKDRIILADLVISTVDMNLKTIAPVVNINVFMTEEDITNLRNEIEAIKTKKNNARMAQLISRFMNEKLFKRNFYKDDEFEMIEALTDECCRLGLTDEFFKNEVLNREALSSTSFGNFVAVPHSLKQNANRSFISFVINEKEMQWGDNAVNIICLIGINRDDRESFGEIFDYLINILSEPANVKQLLKCENYNSLFETIAAMILNTY